jgi:hypothetical protein
LPGQTKSKDESMANNAAIERGGFTMITCEKCGTTDTRNPGDMFSKFVYNSRIAICNDCWLKLTEKEREKIRIKDWRKE